MFLSYDGLNLDEIKTLHNSGLINGVTTNLTLVNSAKLESGKSRKEIVLPLLRYCEDNNLKFSVQVESISPSDIELEAKLLLDLSAKPELFHVKIPANFDNLQIIHRLAKSGVKVNATCVTSNMQARIVTSSGASIVSFFWGKMYDQGLDPFVHVSNYRYWASATLGDKRPTLLVGSVRQIGSIEAAYLAGADVVTTSFLNIRNLSNQFASNAAADSFYLTNLN
jgi:transaldolase